MRGSKNSCDDDVAEKRAMDITNQGHIHPNSKLETQIKPGKFHRTKKAQNKRTEAPLYFTLFKNKEEFIKRMTANEPDKSEKSCVPETTFISKESKGYIPRIKDLKDYQVSLTH